MADDNSPISHSPYGPRALRKPSDVLFSRHSCAHVLPRAVRSASATGRVKEQTPSGLASLPRSKIAASRVHRFRICGTSRRTALHRSVFSAIFVTPIPRNCSTSNVHRHRPSNVIFRIDIAISVRRKKHFSSTDTIDKRQRLFAIRKIETLEIVNFPKNCAETERQIMRFDGT